MTDRKGNQGDITPREMYLYERKLRQEKFFWENNAINTRNMIANEIALRNPTLPKEQGARAQPREVYRSPVESAARERRSGSHATDPKWAIIDQKTIDRRVKPLHKTISKELEESIRIARKNLPGIRSALSLIDFVDAVASTQTVVYPSWEFDGYIRCDGPYPPSPDYAPTFNGFWYAPGSLHCTDFQLGGQGFGSGFHTALPVPTGTPILFDSPGPNQFMIGNTRTGGSRWEENASYYRLGSEEIDAVGVYNESVVTIGTAIPISTANVERWLPPFAQPIPQAIYTPLGLASGAVPAEFAGLSPATQRAAMAVPSAWAFAVGSRGGPPTKTPTQGRTPPAKGTKETKTMSRVAAFGVAVYKVADFISEAGDIIDAVYQALPADVRKRWDRPNRKVDNFGQYGIGGADWKLQALWHNWHRLDAAQAVENIAKNALEDQIYGAIHKRLPKQAGGMATEQAWEQFGEIMQSLGF